LISAFEDLKTVTDLIEWFKADIFKVSNAMMKSHYEVVRR
jgi:hypothetical protein